MYKTTFLRWRTINAVKGMKKLCNVATQNFRYKILITFKKDNHVNMPTLVSNVTHTLTTQNKIMCLLWEI